MLLFESASVKLEGQRLLAFGGLRALAGGEASIRAQAEIRSQKTAKEAHLLDCALIWHLVWILWCSADSVLHVL